jgi:hypothetical protein
MTQEQLFNEWSITAKRILELRSYIQKDFDRMLADDYIQKDQIKQTIPEFEDIFHRNIVELTKLKDEIIIFLTEKSN